MITAGEWVLNQQNTILFPLVDSNGNEIAGLGSTFDVKISKGGADAITGSGTKSEVNGLTGIYAYIATAGEADTAGPILVQISGTGIVRQNLEYVIGNRVRSGIEFTYTLTEGDNVTPISGAEVYITTDLAGANVVWYGTTDAFGVARYAGALPRLDAGTYYFFSEKTGYHFDNPDQEVVS